MPAHCRSRHTPQPTLLLRMLDRAWEGNAVYLNPSTDSQGKVCLWPEEFEKCNNVGVIWMVPAARPLQERFYFGVGKRAPLELIGGHFISIFELRGRLLQQLRSQAPLIFHK